MGISQKELHEAQVFRAFVAAAGLPIDPFSIQNEGPPYPDIRCLKGDAVCRFELAEVLWEDPDGEVATIAHGLARSKSASEQKAALITAGRHEEADQIQTWGSFGSPALASLLHVLQKKCLKRYQLDDDAVSLLLYYERADPMEPYDRLMDDPLRRAIHMLLSTSPFREVWLYHHATAYTFTFSEGSGDAVISVPLRDLTPPESQRGVIGHISIAGENVLMSFDATYSERYNLACDALDAAREQYRRAGAASTDERAE